jgi:hypothetical protein
MTKVSEVRMWSSVRSDLAIHGLPGVGSVVTA